MIEARQSLEGVLGVGVKNVYPNLSDLEVVPKKEEQTFNHEDSYGYDNVIVKGINLQDKEISISENNTNYTVNADELYSGLNQVDISVNIEEKQPILQNKEVTPTKETQMINYDEEFDGLESVIVNAIPNEYIIPSGELDIDRNGKHNIKEYETVNVLVEPVLQGKEITPTKSLQEVVADDEYYGLSNVKVNPIPDEYIIPNGELDIKANGEVDVTSYRMARVGVFTPPNLQDKEVTPNKEIQAITSDDGYDGLNEVKINPIPDEYLIPTGTLEINENGIKDVTNYESVNVNLEIKADPILQDKEITITENTTTIIKPDDGYDGLNEVSVITEVAGSGGGDGNSFTFSTNDAGVTPSTSNHGINLTIKENVPDYAFYNNVSNKLTENELIREVSFTDNITSIGQHAFNYSTKLTIPAQKLPESITSIGQYAFSQCTNLVLTELPNKLTSISNYAFNRCTNLAIKELPSDLVSIGDYAFFLCSNITLSKLPESITSIGIYSFGSCSNITLTKLPDNLTGINAMVFSECSKLALTYLPEGVTMIGNNAFQNCKLLALTKIPDNTRTIGSGSFLGCTGLKQLSMNNIISIGSNCFSSCTGLKTIWIGSAITSGGFNKSAFSNCTNITKMFIDLPRATVEAFTNYSYAFSNSAVTTDVIICNDDEGFMTKEEFDAIDWSTYTG